MGKKQHQKDKMYLTSTEWAMFYGGKKPDIKEKAGFRRLPFYCCALSLQPFENPLCTADGTVFDLMNIIPYLQKYGHHPITGEPLEAKSLIHLKFHKNNEGQYHCPVTYKVFNDHSYIVAIKTTGNVFSNEAIEQLNIKPKNFKDLLTDEPFKRSDMITIQDPMKLEKFNIADFHYLKHNLSVDDDELENARNNPYRNLKSVAVETKSALEKLYANYKSEEKKEGKEGKEKATRKNAAHYSIGAVAQSFTSTTHVPVTENEAAIVDRDILRYRLVKSKAYARLHTNLGDLNLELHADQVPRTCENFVKLCKSHYYDDTVFHRSIRNFMIQGGDPTGTGRGGESAWGKPFNDEFKPNLAHQGRGIVSMANSGPNTNKSQFFITFRSCRHLDNKHTVFGRVVGGFDVLNTMEKIETDDKDHPTESIMLIRTTVFVDPYEEADKKLEDDEADNEESENTTPAATTSFPLLQNTRTTQSDAVGKYIKKQPSSTAAAAGEKRQVTASETKESEGGGIMKKAKLNSTKKGQSFGNFDNW